MKMNVLFHYVDFDGSRKTAVANVKAVVGEGMHATNLSMFGQGKTAATVKQALMNLIGQRTVIHWEGHTEE